MTLRVSLRQLPLRAKLAITIAAAALALLGISTHLSFRYWEREALAAAEQEALLAAGSVRAAVESALVFGEREQARRGLRRLLNGTPVLTARVYAADGTILLSANPGEEGRRDAGIWIPEPRQIPARGLAREAPERNAVRAYLPLKAPGAAVLELELSVAPTKAAMQRGARLGIGLLVASLLGLGAILFTFLEREVVTPIARVSGLLDRSDPGGARPREDELGRLEASVAHLIRKGEAAERLASAQRRQLAEQAGLAQVGELAAEMAHEFKRPLASVMTAIRLLEQEYVLDEKGQAMIAAVEGQLDHLTETMRDLFALARPLEVEREPIGLAELLDGALAQVAGHPAAAAVTFRREYDDAAPPLHGDRRRLEQAVANVLLNAVEAMPKGGTLSLRGRRAGPGEVMIEVEDTGPGIPPEEVDKVLLPFYSTKPQGTGLGLPLVARIVAAHDGRLAIEGRPGTGTVVRIHLPVPAGGGADRVPVVASASGEKARNRAAAAAGGAPDDRSPRKEPGDA